MLKRAEATNASQERMDNLTTALEKWEAKLAERKTQGFWGVEKAYYIKKHYFQNDLTVTLSKSNKNYSNVLPTPTTPPCDQVEASPPIQSKTVVASSHDRNRSNHRQQRRAATKRNAKANRSPEAKIAAAEALLENISNQAINMCQQKQPSSQRPARNAYKAARRAEMENETQLEQAELAVAFQGCGYSTQLTGIFHTTQRKANRRSNHCTANTYSRC